MPVAITTARAVTWPPPASCTTRSGPCAVRPAARASMVLAPNSHACSMARLVRLPPLSPCGKPR